MRICNASSSCGSERHLTGHDMCAVRQVLRNHIVTMMLGPVLVPAPQQWSIEMGSLLLYVF